jgi:hypothetical protein
MTAFIERREFIAALGGAAAWPVVARAQQPTMPVIGLLDSRSPEAMVDRLRGFRQGLKEMGYVEGDDVTIVYRWAENYLIRALPGLLHSIGSCDNRKRRLKGRRAEGARWNRSRRHYVCLWQILLQKSVAGFGEQ